jgi:alkylation response protein AidB-like acyl-CoA dehydrogenase
MLPIDQETEIDAAEFLARAESLVPLLREHAERTEAARHVPDEIVEAAVDAGLMGLMVPRSFGGAGLGVRPLAQIARILAHGDLSGAWVICFLIEHNWMVARFPEEAQREALAERGYLLAAGSLAMQGDADPVDGGWRLTGHWRYCSAMPNADWALLTAGVPEGDARVPWSFMVPKAALEVHDDWFMSGLCGTGSVSVSGTGIIVPTHRGIKTEDFHSALQHHGVSHPESSMRYPVLSSLAVMMAGFAIGAAERAVELLRDRLVEAKVWGVPRIDIPTARARWIDARQKTRMARFLFEELVTTVETKGDAMEDSTEIEDGELIHDRITIAHLCAEVVRLVAFGSGSSAFSLTNPIQRYLRDIEVLANHVGNDWDSVADRAGRFQLGLGRLATDPHPVPAIRQG